MTTSDTTGDRGATWLDDHVELFAVGALTPDETRRVESELAALPPHERAEHDAQIADIQAAMAGFATTYALDAPPELRDRVLQHVFEGAALTPEAYVPSGIDPGPQNPAAAVDPVPPVAPAGTGRSGESDLAPPPPGRSFSLHAPNRTASIGWDRAAPGTRNGDPGGRGGDRGRGARGRRAHRSHHRPRVVHLVDGAQRLPA